ncbi:ankyrin [Colletotrichum falcatum]|nr:ankyrin [Colletotrichum falcatum]
MPPRAKKTDIKDEEWERFQPVIRMLYLDQDKSLKDLATILGMSYGFCPSKAQLEWKLTQWRMTKKMGTEEWKYVHHRIRSRQAAEKQSRVYLSGVRLRDATIEKARARHCYETALEKSRGVVAPPSPTDLSLIIRTPSPQRIPGLDYMRGIPWLAARNLIKDFNVLVPSRVDKHFQLPGDMLLMLATGRPLVQTNHKARLQSTFEALSLIVPEQLQQDHVYHAESLLVSSKNGSNITGALQVMLFLLSNNFFDREGPFREEHDKVISVLLDVLPQTDGWAALMLHQYAELPGSIQSALDRLFKEAVPRSELDLVRSLVRMGVDVSQPTSTVELFGFRRSATAFEYAIFTNNRPLKQLLVELDANHPSSDPELIQLAGEYRDTPPATLIPVPTADLLSNFISFHADEDACELLRAIASSKADPLTEQFFEFFRTRLRSPASRSELLASAIKAQSRIVRKLLLEDREQIGAYVNHPAETGATPIMAAIEIGDTTLLHLLIHLGASLDPPRSFLTSCSPLQYAAHVSDAEMLRNILRHGVNLNYCHPSSCRFSWHTEDQNTKRLAHAHIGKTALQSALLGGKAENAALLLEAGASLVGSELAIAIASRQHAVVDELLAKGASFRETSTISDTLSILEAAVLTQDTDLISLAIGHSSQAVVASSLWAAIFVARSTSDLSMFQLLLGHVSVASQPEGLYFGTAMFLAAIFGVLDTAELMLASGLRPEKCLIVGCEADTEDLRYGNLQVPEDYVQWRQSISVIHAKDRKEHDLLDSALSLVNARGVGFFILLRQHGYRRALQCPGFGNCPSLESLQTLHSFGVEMTSRILSRSIADECYDVTEWLLASGVDVNLTNEHGSRWAEDTPVQAAADKGNLPLVEKLKSLGANINAPAAPGGATALQYACIHGYFGLARRLLEFQADPNAPVGRPWRRGALESAAEYGRLDIVQLLLNSGVKTFGSGRFQYVRAIRLARLLGHQAVARLIKSHRPWEKADQRLDDDVDLLKDGYRSYESDEGVDEEETDEEDGSSRGTPEVDFQASGVSFEVPGETFEVDVEKGGDSNADFGGDEEFPEFPEFSPLMPFDFDFGEGLADGVDDPGDVVGWAEAFDTFFQNYPS